MVDEEDRVAVTEQDGDQRQQTLDVGRVQTDARLVEDIENPCRAIAHGAGQLDPLALTEREIDYVVSVICRWIEVDLARARSAEAGERVGLSDQPRLL